MPCLPAHFSSIPKRWTEFWSLEWIASIGERRVIFNNLQSARPDLIQLCWCLAPSNWKSFPIPGARSYFIYFESGVPSYSLHPTSDEWVCLCPCLRPCSRMYAPSSHRCFADLPEWISACHLLWDSPSLCSACLSTLISSWHPDSVEFYPSPVVLENCEGYKTFPPFCVPRNGSLQRNILSHTTNIRLMDALVYLWQGLSLPHQWLTDQSEQNAC